MEKFVVFSQELVHLLFIHYFIIHRTLILFEALIRRSSSLKKRLTNFRKVFLGSTWVTVVPQFIHRTKKQHDSFRTYSHFPYQTASLSNLLPPTFFWEAAIVINNYLAEITIKQSTNIKLSGYGIPVVTAILLHQSLQVGALFLGPLRVLVPNWTQLVHPFQFALLRRARTAELEINSKNTC